MTLLLLALSPVLHLDETKKKVHSYAVHLNKQEICERETGGVVDRRVIEHALIVEDVLIRVHCDACFSLPTPNSQEHL